MSTGPCYISSFKRTLSLITDHFLLHSISVPSQTLEEILCMSPGFSLWASLSSLMLCPWVTSGLFSPGCVLIPSQGVWVPPPCATAWKLLKAIAVLHIRLILFVSQFWESLPFAVWCPMSCHLLCHYHVDFFSYFKQESKAVFCYSILNINRSPTYQTSCFKFRSIYLII